MMVMIPDDHANKAEQKAPDKRPEENAVCNDFIASGVMFVNPKQPVQNDFFVQ